ncbi:MAG: hypothetical protein V2I51_13535 [Anderseniella sp.]|jgi:hypothetical protein|nr:hypothetical protein [Anderseniella sp.]
MNELLLALQQSELAQAMRQARWLYPAVNTAHIFGIALLFGSLATLHLRTLGLVRGPDAATLERLVTPVAASGFLLAAASGAAMFTTDAVKYAGSSLFLAKMALLALGLVNVIWLKRKRAARPAALVSLTVWSAAIICGRLIGYS